jgi:hypothetical protein
MRARLLVCASGGAMHPRGHITPWRALLVDQGTQAPRGTVQREYLELWEEQGVFRSGTA